MRDRSHATKQAELEQINILVSCLVGHEVICELLNGSYLLNSLFPFLAQTDGGEEAPEEWRL